MTQHNSIESDIALAIAGRYNGPNNRLSGEHLILFIVALTIYHNRRNRRPEATSAVLAGLPVDLRTYTARISLLLDTLKGLVSTAKSVGVDKDYDTFVRAFEEEALSQGLGPAPAYETARFLAQRMVDDIRAVIDTTSIEQAFGVDSIDEQARDAIFRMKVSFPDRDYRDHLQLRFLLAQRCGIPLYTDDGELSTSMRPHIDFLRDSPAEIRSALVNHAQKLLKEQTDASNGVDQQGN